MTELAPRFHEASPLRIVHALGLVIARAVLLFGVGINQIAPRILGTENIFAGDFRSLAVLAVLLGALDVGLVLVLGLLVLGRVTLRGLGWRADELGRDVALGLAGFAVCSALLVIGFVIAGGSPLEPFLAARDFTLAQRAMFLLVAVLGAAIVEETIFRGYLQPVLVRRFGLLGGIVVSAILFDLMHMNFSPASLFTKFAFGMVFGALRGRDRSLVAPAIAHGMIWAVYGA